MGDNEIEDMMDKVEKQLLNNKALNLEIENRNSIRLIDLETNEEAIWIGGGHAMTISEVNEDGIVVSSWGSKYFVPKEDLMNKPHDFNILQVSIGD